MRSIPWLAVLAVALVGCSGQSPDGQSLAGVPGLRPVVQRYYEARATEGAESAADARAGAARDAAAMAASAAAMRFGVRAVLIPAA